MALAVTATVATIHLYHLVVFMYTSCIIVTSLEPAVLHRSAIWS